MHTPGEPQEQLYHRAEPVADFEPDLAFAPQLIESSPHSHRGRIAMSGEAVVVPFPSDEQIASKNEAAHNAVRDHEVYRVSWNPKTLEVTVESDVTLEQIEADSHPDDIAAVKEWAEPLIGKSAVFINPTLEGGGVAMMRPALLHYLRLLGVDAHWAVMAPTADQTKSNPFLFTKQMHNVSQRMSDQRITPDGKLRHWEWADGENGPILEKQDYIKEADFVVIDDPQPAPLFGRLKRTNPSAKFLWRNHIDTDHDLMADPTTPQGEVSDYIMKECGIQNVDAIIAHPQEQFIHPGMRDKTFFAPATFDPFDNLNRHLDDAEIEEGLEFVNNQIRTLNQAHAAAERWDDIIPEISHDPNQQRITLIARFDPAKGMPQAMEMGIMARQRMREAGFAEEDLPEIVIVGNGSIDDPDGSWMFERMLKERRDKYPDEKHAITLVRLHHNYDAINALMTRSTMIMQTSEREGLETRAGDAIRHGVPVVISNRGGIKTQVFEGESGFVLDFDKDGQDLDRGAQIMSYYLTHPEEYAQLAASTKRLGREFNSREFSTIANAGRFLRMFNHLISKPGEPADKVWKMSELTARAA